MKGCVNEYSDCTVDDIVEKYIEGTPEVGSVGVHVDDTNRPKKSTDVIKGSNNEDSTLTEGTLFYDVRFDAIAPKSADSAEQEEVIRLIINVEAQTKFKPGYPLTKRAIYYCSRMISAQHGPIFTKSEYGKIRKVYSIWICTQPSDGFENTLNLHLLVALLLLNTFFQPDAFRIEKTFPARIQSRPRFPETLPHGFVQLLKMWSRHNFTTMRKPRE